LGERAWNHFDKKAAQLHAHTFPALFENIQNMYKNVEVKIDMAYNDLNKLSKEHQMQVTNAKWKENVIKGVQNYRKV
jgi:hypothetical protein